MQIKIESKHLGDVVVLAPDVFQDERGFFMEVYREDNFRSLGLPTNFMQDNHSRSVRNVVRGLHFQWEPPMGKLMRVTVGSAFLVAVDIRTGSPTFGEWFGIEVSSTDKKQVWAPAGTIPQSASSGPSPIPSFLQKTVLPSYWRTGSTLRIHRTFSIRRIAHED